MAILVLIRHGESQANHDHIFTGWTDSPLTHLGVKQAHQAGKKLEKTHIKFSDVHTSYLIRAIDTANIVLDEIDQAYIPEHKTWRLNERHYGALRGKNKIVVKKQVGEKRFNSWHRGFKAVPPLLKTPESEYKYLRVGVHEPLGESLEMTYKRMLPYWIDSIAPRLIDGHNQLIVAHGSTLRALIKYLDHISDKDVEKLEVPNGVPIEYQFDSHLRILSKKIIK
ncbi:2,3-diphosphoglycerate-dependent phosphoglycerate mutase [uncultured bacterium]|uniref:2,3-bisphosphoglycerate-dependent phosphoglycerate mutase n=1 Tax=Acetilactobacillus jinshanensis TaxID=1720083 RepID=UPI0021876D63|nr:2,3-diphosphoglycerate-dependent phosphoglycerate mutase [uncultured bacterium]